MNTAANDFVQVRVWCKDEEQAAVNSLWFRVFSQTGVGVTDLEIATFWDTTLAPLYKPLLSAKATYVGVEAQIRRPGPVPPLVFASALSSLFPGVGTAGTDALPRQDSGLISFRTAFAGPAGRGRNYIPFPSTARATAEGEPTSTYLSDLESLLLAYESFINGDTIVGVGGTALLTWIICQIGPKPNYLLSHTNVTDGVAKTAFATQRRRGTLGKANKSPF